MIADTVPALKLFPSRQADKHGKTGKTVRTHQHQETGRHEEISQTKNSKNGGEGRTGRGDEEASIPLLQMPHPLTPHGRVLIEELRSEVFASYKMEGEQQICTPEHSVVVVRREEWEEDEGGKRDVVKVTVKLPGVQGVKDVDLDVSEVSFKMAVHLSL